MSPFDKSLSLIKLNFLLFEAEWSLLRSIYLLWILSLLSEKDRPGNINDSGL